MGLLEKLGLRRPAVEERGAPQAQFADGWVGYSLDDPSLAAYLRGLGMEPIGGGPDAALHDMAVFRCVGRISSSIGGRPFGVKRRTRDGVRAPAEDHPVHRLLALRPNSFQSPFTFKSTMQGQALIAGNAYAPVV